METLVDLLFKQQLAAEQGITLSEDELAAAIAADGTQPGVASHRGAGRPAASVGDRPVHRRRTSPTRAPGPRRHCAALEAGTPIADLVDEYSPATAAQDGDIGYRTLDDLRGIDPAWAEALFALEEGGITEVTDTPPASQLIGVVTEIVPETTDPGFVAAVNEQVGEGVHRRNVELEALARQAGGRRSARTPWPPTTTQVSLAEILVAGDTLVGPGG